MLSLTAARTHLALVLVACALLVVACGDAQTTATTSGTATPSDGSDHTHAPGEPSGHLHGEEHGHTHKGDEIGPPPVDVGPAVHHGPNDGIVVRISRVDEPDFGFAEVKLHDDKGDIELWLARDRDMTEPFDLPIDAVLTVQFPDLQNRMIELRVRDKIANQDEAGTPTVREGKTNYFIFPGDTGADARWLRGASFSALARVTFVHGGQAHVSDDFSLVPHGHDGDHGHEHDK